MKRLLLLLFCLPLTVFGQTNYTPIKASQVKAYCQVITEYIKALNKSDTLHFDTLFIGKHEDFPDIQLPESIHNKKIMMLTYRKGEKEYQHSKSFVFINIIELKFTEEQVNFMLVTFHQGFRPQHNCHLDLKYNPVKKTFELDKEIKYDYPYAKNH